MINLLPNEQKEDIRAARANVIIVRYIVIITCAILFIGIALYVSYSVLRITMNSANDVIAANDVKASVYSETKKEVDGLSSQLADAKAILDQEVQYSKVLVKIGQLMPAGTVLGAMTLKDENFVGGQTSSAAPIEVTAYARSATEASQLQTQCQGSPLFNKVELKSTGTESIDGYPVNIILSIVLNKAGI